MTKDECIVKLLEILTSQQMQKEANDVYELCAYVDRLEKKVDTMSIELSDICQELKAVRENTIPHRIKEQIQVVSSHLKEQCQIMKTEITMMKEQVASKAQEISTRFRKAGHSALYQISEVTRLKQGLLSLRNRVDSTIEDVKDTIVRIDELGNSISKANQQMANAYRTFRGKQEVDYTAVTKGKTMAEILVEPWKSRQTMLESMKQILTATIEKVSKLEQRVQYDRSERNVEQTEEQDEDRNEQGTKFVLVAEKENLYGEGGEVKDELENVKSDEIEIEEAGRGR